MERLTERNKYGTPRARDIPQSHMRTIIERLCEYEEAEEQGRIAITPDKTKICENCGKPFMPKRSDAKYCDKASPQDKAKTCKEYGARSQYQENLANSESMKLYRKIYMAKQMRAKRNPDFNSAFERYKEEARRWKADVKAGVKTESEYVEWLKGVKRSA